MPYLCLGYPDEEKTFDIAKMLIESGANEIELGIPFSDSIADGSTIQKASQVALKNGMTGERAFKLIKQIKDIAIAVPITVMAYYNTAFSIGLEAFLIEIKKSGASRVLFPDLPLEESEPVMAMSKRYGVDLVLMIAPNSDEERIKQICSKATGLVYLVSTLGVTGERKELPAEFAETMRITKRYSKVPLVVGFGISNKNQVQQLKIAGADGFIIGSKLITLYKEGGLEKVKGFCETINV